MTDAAFTPLSDSQISGIFENIRNIKEVLAKLADLGIDWTKLGPFGSSMLDAIKVISDGAATAAAKVDAAITAVEAWSLVTTKTVIDDNAAAWLRRLEPVIVRIVQGFTGAAALSSDEIKAEAAALGIDLGNLWKIAQLIWELIQLFRGGSGE